MFSGALKKKKKKQLLLRTLKHLKLKGARIKTLKTVQTQLFLLVFLRDLVYRNHTNIDFSKFVAGDLHTHVHTPENVNESWGSGRQTEHISPGERRAKKLSLSDSGVSV